MLKYKKVMISILSLTIFLSMMFFLDMYGKINADDSHKNDESFIILDEDGNPQIIEVETETQEDIASYNDILNDENQEDSLENNSTIHPMMRMNTRQDLNQKEEESYSKMNSMMRVSTSHYTQHIVRFKTVAELSGNTMSYIEMDTGREGYFSTNMANDAAYIATDSRGDIICKLSGVVMKVSSKAVKEIVPYSSGNVSYYYVNDGKLLHYFSYINGSSVRMSSNRVGYKPSYLESGKKYYSYDGHYFYSSFADMILDYKNYENNDHSRAINKSNPYYNYYQYLSLRSKTNFTANDLNERISSTSSQMYNKGQTFIDCQNTYGINASLMFGIAINESAYGTSSIAKTKNNLFGLNAVDKSPSQSANYFSSVDQCIKEFAYNWMSKGYLNGTDSRYRGPHLGDKRSGINVKYASDPYWGEKGASQGYFMDNANKDYGYYQIGISKSTELFLYKETNTSQYLYTSGVSGSGKAGYLYDYPIFILNETNVLQTKWYKVQSDMPLKDDRSMRNVTDKYNFERDYVYAQATYIDIVNIGKNVSSNTKPLYLTGDVNGDGKVTSLDYIQVKNHIMGTKILTSDALKRADVNGDGKVTSLDYIKIKNHIMGTNLLF